MRGAAVAVAVVVVGVVALAGVAVAVAVAVVATAAGGGAGETARVCVCVMATGCRCFYVSHGCVVLWCGRSIRTWVRTREMLNVEEEASLAREQEYDREQVCT